MKPLKKIHSMENSGCHLQPYEKTKEKNLYNRKNKKSLKKAQHIKIENVVGSV
jgi:hypothetical protein